MNAKRQKTGGKTDSNALNAFSAASIMAEAEAKAKLAEVEARANR